MLSDIKSVIFNIFISFYYSFSAPSYLDSKASHSTVYIYMAVGGFLGFSMMLL